MDKSRTRISRLAKWSALVAVGALVVMACRPEDPTPQPTDVATEAPSTAPVSATLEPTPEPTAEPIATEAPMESIEPAASEEPSFSTPPAVVEGPAVSGTFELPEEAELPEGATWSVELQDTSLADAPAVVIGEDSGDIEDTSVTEVEFEIAYDPDQIIDTNTYTLQVRVEDETGNLLFVNDTAVPVLTDGGETTEVSFPVVAVEAMPEATAETAEGSPEA